MTKGTCEGCGYWASGSRHIPQGNYEPPIGECTMTAEIWSPIHPYTTETHLQGISLVTVANFGCNHWVQGYAPEAYETEEA